MRRRKRAQVIALVILLALALAGLSPGGPGHGGALAASSTGHTSAADFATGARDPGFRLSSDQDGGLALPPLAPALTAWEQAGAALPAALREHSAVAAGGSVVVIGGESAAGVERAVRQALIRPDRTLGPWQDVAPLPVPLLRHAAVASGELLFVLGGATSRIPPTPQAMVYRSKLAADGAPGPWVELPAAALPAPIEHSAAVALDGAIYLIGGTVAGVPQATVLRAELTATGGLAPWRPATPLPTPLFSHAAATLGSCMFVAGGQIDAQFGLQSAVYAAVGGNGPDLAWRELSESRLPRALSSHAMVAAGGQLWVIGGDAGAPDYDQDSVYRAGVNADCTLAPWQQMAPFPEQVVDHAAVAADDLLLVLGGRRFGNLAQYDGVFRALASPEPRLGDWSSSGAPLPEALAAHTLTRLGEALFVTGGESGGGVQSTVYRAPLSAEGLPGAWAQDGALPVALRDHSALADGDRLLVFGGNDGQADRAEVYEARLMPDGRLGDWRVYPCRLPEALSGHATVLAGDFVYLSGGRQGFEERNQVYRMQRADQGTAGCWQAVAALPQPLAEHAMVVAGDRLLVSGGTTGAGGDVLDRLAMASILADGSLTAWADLAQARLPTFLSGHSMVASGDALYLAGGIDPFSFTARHQIYRARLDPAGIPGAWQELATTPLPYGSYGQAAIATDLHMIIVGGRDNQQARANVSSVALARGVPLAAFVHQFDLGGDTNIGQLSWASRGSAQATLGVRFRIADTGGAYGPWSQAYTSSPVPIFERGRYLQYQLVVTNPGAGPRAIDGVELSFGDVGDYVRVVDQRGQPVSGAMVYLNGVLLSQRTSDRGVLTPSQIGPLAPGSRLVAMRQVAQAPTTRAAHTSADSPQQGWAYRTMITSLHVTPDGTLQPYVVGSPGAQVLAVRRDQALVLFNLVVSIEWRAERAYLEQIERAVRRASDYLYDVSDGQMAFGAVRIFDDAAHWTDADIQISTKNAVRPHAYIGGIRSADPSYVIRVGRHWDGQTGSAGPWDEPNGYRTLVHEFGHYGLSLYDEYFGYRFLPNGSLDGINLTNCTAHEKVIGGSPALNASIMDYQYTRSELAMRGVPALWSPTCEETAQWQMNRDPISGAGESDWETIRRLYRDDQPPSDWQILTPLDRGGVVEGPAGLPADTLDLPTVTVDSAGGQGITRVLTVYGPTGPYPGALVALYTTRESLPMVIDQGFTDRDGRIAIYGAQSDDSVRAISFDGALSGTLPVSQSAQLALVMEPPRAELRAALLAGDALGISAPGPYFTLRPFSTRAGGAEQVGLYVRLEGLGPGSLLLASLTPTGGSTAAATALAYSGGEQAYSGAFTLGSGPGAAGTGSIQVAGSTGGSSGLNLSSTYALQRAERGRALDLHSADGGLRLRLLTDTLSIDRNLVIAPLPGLPGLPPPGMRLVGNAYQIALSGADSGPEQPFLVELHYDKEVARDQLVAPATLRVYRWEPDATPGDSLDSAHWSPVESQQLAEEQILSAATRRTGIYALMGSSHRAYLPIVGRAR